MTQELREEIAVVFDLDDTLYHEEDFVFSGFAAVARRMAPDRSGPILTRMKALYRSGEKDVYEKILGEFQCALKKDDLIEVYRNHRPEIQLRPDAKLLLENLKNLGVPMGLVTDGRRATQHNKVEALGIKNFFEKIVVSEEIGTTKPDVANFRPFEERFQNRRIIMVGDNPRKDFLVPNQWGWNTFMLKNQGRNIHSQTIPCSADEQASFPIESLDEIMPNLQKRMDRVTTTNFTRSVGKRIFDVIVALPVFILSLVVMAPIACLLWLTQGRPVFFKQLRPGLNGKPFSMYKFRTMTNSKGRDGTLMSDEQRLTSFGRFLRRTSLDELPELINVLKGDMSLVGPRPLLMRYLPRYSAFQARRHEVNPGITGWAQVNGRNAISWEEKFALDVWYVDNQSLFLDAKILLRTVGKVLFGSGVSQPGHATMEEFQGSSRCHPKT